MAHAMDMETADPTDHLCTTMPPDDERSVIEEHGLAPSRTQNADAGLRAAYQEVIERPDLNWAQSHHVARCLGSGGQGVVYLGERAGSDGFTLPVALKVFTPNRYADRDDYARAMGVMARIAMRVALIQQDHLLDVHNFVSLGPIRVMEMEWIDGYDLQRLLTADMMEKVHDAMPRSHWDRLNDVVVTMGETQPRLKPGIAIAVLRECLGALASLNKNGIVHGDVKPSNIMLKRTGNAKLIDIGAAFDAGDPPRTVVCTPAYAAPEVLEGRPPTAQSDLASLGYVLVEMLSGKKLFAGITDRDELLEAKTHLASRPDRALPHDVVRNDLLMSLIGRLIAIDPDQRFPDAEAADLLDRGAASFQRQLVKGDLSSEYDIEIQTWLSHVG
jgi:serine/threonine-protein kinase